jgi:hypothetical protein
LTSPDVLAVINNQQFNDTILNLNTPNLMKTTAFLLIALFITTQAQQCDNPLLNLFGFTGLGSPVNDSGSLQFCNNLRNNATCCSADVVNNFPSTVNQERDQLQGIAANRDLFFVEAKTITYPGFRDNYQAWSTQLGILNNTNSTIFDAFIAKFGNLNDVSGALNSSIANLGGDYASYQNLRAACFKTLLQIEADAYCLSCDPNFANDGVSPNGNITYSDSLCSTMKDSCFDFANDSSKYTLFASLNRINNILVQANTFLTSLDLTSPDVLAVINNQQFNDTLGDRPLYELETRKDKSCTTKNDCNWICTDWIPNAVINDDLVSLGGIPVKTLRNQEIIDLAAVVAPVVVIETVNVTNTTVTNTTGGTTAIASNETVVNTTETEGIAGVAEQATETAINNTETAINNTGIPLAGIPVANNTISQMTHPNTLYLPL